MEVRYNRLWSPCPLSVRLLTQFFCFSDCMHSDKTYCYDKNVLGKGTCSQGLIGQACGRNDQCIDGRCERGSCVEKIALDQAGSCNEARYVQVFTLLAPISILHSVQILSKLFFLGQRLRIWILCREEWRSMLPWIRWEDAG